MVDPLASVAGAGIRAGVAGYSPSPSGMQTFASLADALNKGALGFAAGFGKDPARRELAASQLAQAQEQELREQQLAQQQLQAMLAQTFERFKLYASTIQGVGSDRIPSSMRAALESEAQILDALAPGEGQRNLQFALSLADMPREDAQPKMVNVVGRNGENLGMVDVNNIDAMAKLPPGARLAGEVSQPLPAYSAERQQQELAQSRAGASQTNIITPFESQSQKNLADLQAKTMEGMRANADKAVQVLQGVQRLNQAVAGGLETGALQNIAGDVGNYLAQLGVSPEVTEGLLNASNTAEFRKASAELVRGVSGSLGTGFSNADRDFLERTLPNINDPQQATLAVLGYLAERAQGEIAVFDQSYDTYSKGGDPVGPYRDYLKRIGASVVPPSVLQKTEGQPQGGGVTKGVDFIWKDGKLVPAQ